MAWWSALWLNEGDASLWEYLGTQAVHPEFEIMRQFVVGDVADAMSSTWYGNSRKLVNAVTSSEQIEASFDGVAYSFGASILFTLRNYCDRTAPGAYFTGMQTYNTVNFFTNNGSLTAADLKASIQMWSLYDIWAGRALPPIIPVTPMA